MCVLNTISIRKRRISFPKQLSKKIHKKTHQYIVNKKYQRVVPLDTSVLEPNFPPPPPKIITWEWNTHKQEDVRNWLELPPDVTLRVFSKLETLDIILTVSQVCSPWRNLSKDPILYRSVVISGYDPVFRGKWMWGFRNIARKAADRSCGKLRQFSCGNMGKFSIEDIRYAVNSSSSLKSLRLGLCNDDIIPFEETLEIVSNIPSLEELYLRCYLFPPGTLQNIGGCPKLKYVEIGIWNAVDGDIHAEALEIAKSMPGLRSLRLLANGLTNKGLQAILDGCPHLEYVYLKGFSNVDRDLLKEQCHNIKSITVLSNTQHFGEECEIHLKANTNGQCLIELSGMVEEVGDYGVLSRYNSYFLDYYEPYIQFYWNTGNA